MSKWSEMLGASDGPPLSMELQKGDILATEHPTPEVEVQQSTVLDIERLVYHAVVVTAKRDGRSERIAIGRLVAVLKDGGEMEFERQAYPAEQVENDIDQTTCRACNGKIPTGEAVMLCAHLGIGGMCNHPGVRCEGCEYERDSRFHECAACSGAFVAYHSRCVQ